MAEIAPAGGGPNRLFVVLALGLAGLLILGLIALGGFFVIQNLTRGAAAAPTVKIAQTTPTRAPATATAPPTATLAPTDIPTPTLVFSGGASPVAATATVIGGGTGTPATTGVPGTGQLPRSGLGDDLLLLAGGLVLVAIMFVARRARTNDGV